MWRGVGGADCPQASWARAVAVRRAGTGTMPADRPAGLQTVFFVLLEWLSGRPAAPCFFGVPCPWLQASSFDSSISVTSAAMAERSDLVRVM